MNVSLLRDSKPAGERRGSKGSNNRVPSRQPSLASLRPQSPAGQSQGNKYKLFINSLYNSSIRYL
ncbi:hypothetical protein O3M35_000592 [Rhynocoris fuscipes]|uniref:Uncharacterized protein n=1 Tax=Rhynocoris fuscipes TaxID=488301 RepID=A0AAW1DMA0_9HEMI